MKRVLVTGASGFIGRHALNSLLEHDFELHAVARGPQSKNDRLTWHAADLFDEAAVSALMAETTPSHLLHLAWITEPGQYWQSAENRSWLESSIHLLDEFRRRGGTRAVIAGTCAEYDWTDGHCVEDQTPCRAGSPYTAAKLQLREHALAADVAVVWARVFFTFGPFERPERLVPSIVLPLLDGERAECTDGAQIRDFMYVRDIAAALAAVLDHEFCGDINIASGRPLALRDMITRIGTKLGALERIDFGARKRAADEPPRITADTTRLNEIVGWRPGYSLDAALDETIAWWQQKQ